VHLIVLFFLGPVYFVLFFGVLSFCLILIFEFMGLVGGGVLDPILLKLNGG